MATPIPLDKLQDTIEREFECLRCGNCCKGEGLVHFGPAEADRMAECLGLKRAAFLKQYAIRVKEDYWMLKDRLVEPAPYAEPELWCIFLERGSDGLYGCRVNAGKPDQCGSFPYQWRNRDSMQSCAGLRHLIRKIREEKG